ncbi:tetratricopeptide repeat protein [Pseudomarimonas arenosa]|uniref:Tetratricopeptide repeat protein n=1 Tax=Pseudomarimonas arenosa TaxID=2774145 RepID=A0AAW3ZSX7_9GAMM|nr:tetratricopeptide repeat protein [Pseudomarimonas arenosa]MBD8528147.1 tetratricopeptide repeat protein [Pseudomarimonas arenosa]
MHLLGILLLVVQIAFAIHAVRTGKEFFWLWLILLVPGIGCAVYFFTQVLPELGSSHTVKRARNSLIKAIDPQREFKRRKEMLEIADTEENRVALADECIEARMFPQAIELLQSSLKGMHKDDPAILERLARAQFENAEPAKTIATLDALISAHPNHKSPDGHLLYARALEADGQLPRACEEYDVLRDSFPGEEARVRYAQMLVRMGQHNKAQQLCRESLLRAKRAPTSYQKREREWLQLAQRLQE